MIRKQFISIIIFFVLFSSTLLAPAHCNPTQPILNQKEIGSYQPNNQSFQQSFPDIEITEVTDGRTLSLTIKNNELYELTDIDISFKISGGIILNYQNKITISHLSTIEPEDTTTITNTIFGFGLGIISTLPKITIIAEKGSNSMVLATIEAKILGRNINIINSILNDNISYQGYTLYAPEYTKNTYLIDNDGNTVHMWEGDYIQGMGTYLLENGNLIRTDLSKSNPTFPLAILGGQTGHVGIYTPSGENIWDFTYSTDQHILHHDIEPLPNGNFLLLSWTYKTGEQAINAGRNPSITSNKLFIDYIIEVKPNGQNDADIVWEWHLWDHIIQDYDSSKANYGNVKNHPELIDINYRDEYADFADFTHINSIDYHEEYDQILLSVRNFNEIWIIDHSTTTQQAAGHSGGRYGKGGDILYRWGNPQTYRAGEQQDQQFYHQHDATWIPEGYPGEGNILVFNNLNPSDNNHYSTVEEITPPVDDNGRYYKFGASYGPSEPTWQYASENLFDFQSNHLSSAQRLPNGNTLLCEGAKGKFSEVTSTGDIVWTYTNSKGIPNHVFKVHRYSPNHPGIEILLNT